MNDCPKCGCMRISGPRYEGGWGFKGERLRYVCDRCGYSETTPTLDHNKDKRAVDDVLRGRDVG